MLFRSIVIDSALRKQLGYQIPADKVMWDRQGNLKKLSLSSENVGTGSLARPPSKKSLAHKNIDASSKAATDSQPIRTAAVFGPPPNSKAQGSSSTLVVEEGLSGLKQKSGEDAFSLEPSTKKR
jgi:hypothetical protein